MSVLILTSFRSPELVGTLDGPLNPKVGYVVKSDVVDLDVLRDAIEQTLASEPPRRAALAGVPVVTRGQAEVLRLMAEGLSNAAIAQRRGCSARALERIIARLYTALGISDDAQGNARVQAVTVFRDGGVDVNGESELPGCALTSRRCVVAEPFHRSPMQSRGSVCFSVRLSSRLFCRKPVFSMHSSLL